MGKSRRSNFDPHHVFLKHHFKWTKNENRQPGSKTEPLGHFDVYKFRCNHCNDPWWSEWESAAVDAANGQECRNSKCAGRPPVKPCKGPVSSKTPCCFAKGAFYGRFQCPDTKKCGKKWTSFVTFANKYQKCRRCESVAYSYYMTDERPEGVIRTVRIEHDQPNCEMCKDKPKPCTYEKRGRGRDGRYFLKCSSKKAPPSAPAPEVPSDDTNNDKKKKRNRSKKNKVGAQVKEVSPERDLLDEEGEMTYLIRKLKTNFRFESLSID